MFDSKTTLLAAAVCLSSALQVQADAVKPVTIIRSGVLELSKSQAKGFRKFKKNAGYYGAFVINDQTSDAYWFRDFHNSATAQSAATKLCAELSDNQGTCQLYAVSYPAGDTLNSRSTGLSRQAARAASTRFLSEQEPGKFGAFAVSGASEYGMSWGWEDEAEASGSALARCEAYVARSMANLNNEGRRWAKARGLDRCRIVKLHRPDGSPG